MACFRPGIYFVLSALCILLIELAGCRSQRVCPQSTSAVSSGNTSSQNIDRDCLIGWYKLVESHGLIPVFKIDGTYYSVSRGFEVPLMACPEGLGWDLSPSSMVGTKIGFDETSNEYYLNVMDRQAQYPDEYSPSGKKQYMMRIDKPSGLLDATAGPPRGNDDFLGWYQLVWMPFMRLEIRKDGRKYLYVEHELHDPGVWKTPHEPQEITPLADRLGFIIESGEKVYLTYNEDLKRFELTMKTSAVLRMPLAQIPPPSSPEGKIVPLPVEIGIPSWH